MAYGGGAWNKFEGVAEASGCSKKVWLIDQEGKVGLFKFPKNESTTEQVSERLAYLLGAKIGILCAEVDLIQWDGIVGSLSHLVNDRKKESLNEGITFIMEKHPSYLADTLYDPAAEKYYGLEHILEATRDFIPSEPWIKMLLFDFLIGNTDRHPGNWAVITNQAGERRPSPLYDNGSSLCCYVNDDTVEKLLGRDITRFMAQVDSKSLSRVRIDTSRKKLPTHLEMAKHLLKTYSRIAIPFAHKICATVTQPTVASLLAEFEPCVLSEKRRELIERFLLKKVALLAEALKKEDAEYDN